MASDFTLERSSTMPASPQAVYEQIVDFRRWQQWSPWEELDPDLQRIYSGAESGVGTVYEWSGNKKAGQGRMEMTEAMPSSRVVVALDFVKPFKSSNTTTFTLTPDGSGTRVVWSMTGPRPLLMRIFGFLINPEKMIGPDFEKGLAKLQRVTTSA